MCRIEQTGTCNRAKSSEASSNSAHEKMRKNYSRSLRSEYIAKYLWKTMDMDYLVLMEGIETKNAKVLSMIRRARKVMVDKRFG